MSEQVCPPFLEPRLRLFLSADIVGSTSLKQTRARPVASSDDSAKGPVWFSAIQGFYFEAAQAFLFEWADKKKASELPEELYGDEPTFWKSIGDEVLFTKVLGDHRQLATTLKCWFEAVKRMRKFLKSENSTLDVKCTAWIAGFPYRNREVVIGRYPNRDGRRVENYYKESGNLLNGFYGNNPDHGLSVDYISPSIDTGFRLTAFSTGRKMVVSIDVAYLISMTSFDGEVERIDLHYDGSHQLKGVIGGALYPVFWISMSAESSLAVREDRLKAHVTCNREDLKEYCDAFYREYDSFTFRPFIKGDIGQTMAKRPPWYDDYHSSLVKNFYLPDNEYASDPNEEQEEPDTALDQEDMNEILEELAPASSVQSTIRFSLGDQVEHHKFGLGRVVLIDGNKIEVDFSKVGRKRVLDGFLHPHGEASS